MKLSKEHIDNIKRFFNNKPVLKAYLFGSYSRGDADENSDVDILVAMPEGKSLFDLVHLKLLLEDCLKRRVDIITFQSIHRLLKKRIESEQISVL